MQTQDIYRSVQCNHIRRNRDRKVDGIICPVKTSQIFSRVQCHDKQTDIGIACYLIVSCFDKLVKLLLFEIGVSNLFRGHYDLQPCRPVRINQRLYNIIVIIGTDIPLLYRGGFRCRHIIGDLIVDQRQRYQRVLLCRIFVGDTHRGSRLAGADLCCLRGQIPRNVIRICLDAEVVNGKPFLFCSRVYACVILLERGNIIHPVHPFSFVKNIALSSVHDSVGVFPDPGHSGGFLILHALLIEIIKDRYVRFSLSHLCHDDRVLKTFRNNADLVRLNAMIPCILEVFRT